MSFLERVCTCLEQNKVPYALVGAYAVALHGAPRGTINVDLIVRFQEKDFIALEQAFKSIGLQSKLPVGAREVFQFREDYIQNRNLIAWSFYNPQNPIEIIDVIITHNLEDNSITNKMLSKTPIRVLSKRDLIKMKKQSARPQDLIDIGALERI